MTAGRASWEVLQLPKGQKALIQKSNKWSFNGRIVEFKRPTDHITVEPAGAVFTETLKELNEVDKELLLFSGRGHLSAVSWLLQLGANARTTDSNGTSALHAACRKGSRKVAQFLLTSSTLDSTDCAGWTPLHVAAFMGRHEVVQELLRARAVPTPCTSGQSPLDLCTDANTRLLLQHGDAKPVPQLVLPAGLGPGSEQDLAEGHSEGRPSREEDSGIRYEPFFIPRVPLLDETERDPVLDALCDRLAQKFFDRHGGRGLAFMVASGLVRDFPMDLIAYLRTNECSPRQIGLFLSEDFSLAKILRMEFLNSVRLLDTGVLSALCFGLFGLRMPLDLQRLDRFMWSLAECWWRQHLRAKRAGALRSYGGAEVSGDCLWQVVGTMEDLHELFFSTMILHWNLHAPLPSSQRVTMSAWIEMHRVGGVQIVPEEVLRPIHEVVAKGPMEVLLLTPSPGDEVIGSSSGSVCSSEATLEGWASVHGDGLQPGVEEALQLPMHASLEETISSLCEGTFSARRKSRRSSGAVQVLASPTPRREEAAWLSMCGPLLFLSMAPGNCPFGFVKLKEVELADVDPGRSLLSLQAHTSERLKLILLLPDGRWHVCSMQALVIQLCDVSQLKNWVLNFASEGASGTSKSLLQI
ncbi:Poly [ADP-ribose] polymerase tankyrase-2 (ADP-ribosyltransferase diphtheria toxin-like 6) (ARTD6) (Poly [ADP-ribose] polymerase 5B) (Protein poly-ADP-ribosyltransferase tankyrase-2) (TNKS-2) (TRF1-interacting ankyrin-related ADP-ribose polymerase 2) (Tankyrase II) (Tankyrase-2) (TANK2) (Tankyrase-like protein) (Tankyrase-related protein) [Durusdinium trenchii]|uniref:SEC7 domain-containing protein n=1 Tax=Durusdinium trenchii TaxID=1381693 RepID=A0ABP0M125_9DINO